ncbi:putative transcription factor BES/BZR family [Helianthus annuus]|nr:putative transcription factor BES/BZR family [Helianthus annuus]KAJ0738043.1 putative transcription factor BES/BZR family [Helianthus annuus]
MEMVQKEVVNSSSKSKRGPWLVHRINKDGRVVTRHRFPSDQERQRNCERERKRRSMARKIFSGLRAYGNYKLSKNADTIDLLKALCEEAGWHVEQDGTVYKKVSSEMAQKEDKIDLKLSLSLAS